MRIWRMYRDLTRWQLLRRATNNKFTHTIWSVTLAFISVRLDYIICRAFAAHSASSGRRSKMLVNNMMWWPHSAWTKWPTSLQMNWILLAMRWAIIQNGKKTEKNFTSEKKRRKFQQKFSSLNLSVLRCWNVPKKYSGTHLAPIDGCRQSKQ